MTMRLLLNNYYSLIKSIMSHLHVYNIILSTVHNIRHVNVFILMTTMKMNTSYDVSLQHSLYIMVGMYVLV